MEQNRTQALDLSYLSLNLIFATVASVALDILLKITKTQLHLPFQKEHSNNYLINLLVCLNHVINNAHTKHINSVIQQ